MHTKEKGEAKGRKIGMSASRIIILGFLIVIAVGGILLMLPISSVNGEFTDPTDAFFTATSATCVTGLVIRDTGTEWTMFGKGVIICLIQIGGLGFMTLAMFVAVIMKRTVTPRERLIFVRSMNLNAYDSVIKFLYSVMAFAFTFELSGAVLLAFRFVPIFGWSEGIAKSLFHSVSAFCNAGFDTMGAYSGPFSSLTDFANDYYVNIVISLLIISGGLGFAVWHNLSLKIRKHERLSVYTKLVLIITATLVVAGAVIIGCAEWNSEEFAGLSAGEKIIRAYFQSVTFRTCGFNTIDMGAMSGISKMTAIVLMFIGGSSGSTAGGIKTVTFGLLFIAAFRIARGNKDVVIMKRRVETGVLLRALSLTVISLCIIIFGAVVITFADGLMFSDVVFETFSAFGTVGVSTGITTLFSSFSQWILMSMMFFGRVGILTITYEILMSLTGDKDALRRPKAEFLIG